MSEPARSRTSSLAALVLTAVVVLGADCYKPNVESGGLTCASAPAKPCPDGFTCVGAVCVSATAPDAAVGSGGHGGTASGGHGSGGHLASGGAPGTGGQVSTGGVVGSGGTPPGQPRAVGESCTITDLDAPDQSDNCQAGATCVEDCAQNVCFRTCNTDDDCPGASCTRMTKSGIKFCELAYTACDPHAASMEQGCAGSTSCYLLSSTPAPGGGDRTVCDCPVDEKGLNEPCTESRDCFPGLVCPASTAPGGGFCRQACDPNMVLNTTGCQLLVACNRYGPNWGYCY